MHIHSGQTWSAMQVLQQTTPTRVLWFLGFLAVLGTSTEAQSGTIIKKVTLSVEPAEVVDRGTNLTLTCTADASHASGIQPAYTYSFFKDFKEREIESVSPRDNAKSVRHTIPNTRVFHSGTYQCKVEIDGQSKRSNMQEVVVQGLQTPVLTVDRTVVREGEAVSATCRAEEELGPLTFSIKDGPEDVFRGDGQRGLVQHLLLFQSGRTAKLTCSYFITMGNRILQSNVSKVVSIAVQELNITPSITVLPQTRVVEGDGVSIICSVSRHQQDLSFPSLYLMKGAKILNMINGTYSKDMLTTADSGEYECGAQLDSVSKTSSVNLTVTELFSQPKMIITPSEVFEGQDFTISCHSANVTTERIRHDDVKYTVLRNEENVTLGQFGGVYRAVAGTKSDGNYMCSAQARQIVKRSTSVPFKAKVLVSRPVITAIEKVVLGRPFQILCYSENGSFPINYTLKWKHIVVNHSVSTRPEHQALFTAIIQSEAEIHNFVCGAQNYQARPPVTSGALSALVIVPVQQTFLTVVPTPEDIAEGHDISLICSARRGTPPITFRWYQHGSRKALHTVTVLTNHSSHTLKDAHRQNSGTYYCEAQNHGNADRAVSNVVTFTVNMARWKKALIICLCLLVVALVVIFLLIRSRAKRGRETYSLPSVSIAPHA